MPPYTTAPPTPSRSHRCFSPIRTCRSGCAAAGRSIRPTARRSTAATSAAIRTTRRSPESGHCGELRQERGADRDAEPGTRVPAGGRVVSERTALVVAGGDGAKQCGVAIQAGMDALDRAAALGVDQGDETGP